MRAIFPVVLLSCVSFAIGAKVRVSTSEELRSALKSASHGDHITLEPKTFEGDFSIEIDGVTLAGTNSYGKTATIKGNTALSVKANNVVVEGMFLKGQQWALKMKSHNGKAEALKMTGDVFLDGNNVKLASTETDGDVTVQSSNGKISSNVMDLLRVNGCNNVFLSNFYTRLLKEVQCPNDIGVTNITGKPKSKDCTWYHFWRSCWWG